MAPIPDKLPSRASPRDHLDEVQLIVRQRSSPVLDPANITGGLLCVWEGPLTVSLEDAARYAAAVAWDDEQQVFEPFVVHQRYTQFEWGGSGSALEFVIELVNGLAVESILLGAGYAIGKIRGRDNARSDVVHSPEGLAVDAVAATAAIFEVDRHDLEVVEMEVERRAATVVLRGDGHRFRVSAKRLDTGDPVMVISREE